MLISVRDAKPGDMPRMLELEREAPTSAHWRESDYWRIFAEAVVKRVALIAESDRKIVGFIVLACVGPDWELENIVVATSARRYGVATRLMREGLARAKSCGAERVFLEVRESNDAARGLYGKWLFRETGKRKGYYSNPAEDALVYEKRL